MTRPIKGFWLFLLGLFGLHGGSAHAMDFVLCTTDLVGESAYPGAVGCIDVLAWSWGLSNSGTSGTVFVASLQDISMTKYMDTASEDLFRMVATGVFIKGIVEFRAYNPCSGCSSPVPFMTIRTKGTGFSSLSTGGSGGENRLTENVTMNFTEISYCYRPTVGGALGTAQCFAYSKVTNAAIGPF